MKNWLEKGNWEYRLQIDTVCYSANVSIAHQGWFAFCVQSKSTQHQVRNGRHAKGHHLEVKQSFLKWFLVAWNRFQLDKTSLWKEKKLNSWWPFPPSLSDGNIVFWTSLMASKVSWKPIRSGGIFVEIKISKFWFPLSRPWRTPSSL